MQQGSPADVLEQMSRINMTDRSKNGLPKVLYDRKRNMITFMQAADTKVDVVRETRKRVEEERAFIETNKHGIEVSPVLFEEAIRASGHPLF